MVTSLVEEELYLNYNYSTRLLEENTNIRWVAFKRLLVAVLGKMEKLSLLEDNQITMGQRGKRTINPYFAKCLAMQLTELPKNYCFVLALEDD